MSLKDQFEKWYGTQNKVFQDTFSKAEKGERDRYYYDRVESGWKGFQAGHAAGLEQALKACDTYEYTENAAAAIRAMKP